MNRGKPARTDSNLHRDVAQRVLRIDSSARREGSVSRQLGDEVVRRLVERNAELQVVSVDLARGIEHIDEHWVAANFTPAEERSSEQRRRLDASDEAVAQLQWADAVVLTAPVYNFSVPSVLKAWIDQVCRAGLSFRYTEHGPQGLIADRPVYMVMASGGVPFGSPVDFASGYLKQVLGFIGIADVRLIGADGVASDAGAAMRKALGVLDDCLPAAVGRVA
jgi:FMN-dependent NADH-azoreductase